MGNNQALKGLTSPFKMNHTAKAILYFLVLTLSIPMVFLLLVIPSLFISMITRAFQYSQRLKSSKQVRKTVLVTGAPHTKGLQISSKCWSPSSSGGHEEVPLVGIKIFQLCQQVGYPSRCNSW